MTLSKFLLPTLLLAAAAFPQDYGGQSGTAPQQPSQQSPSTSDATGVQPAQELAPPDKRVFGVLPNYRTANETAVYTSISVKEKFVIASKDSFDYPLVLLASAIAGLGQLTNQNPSFGQGLAGRSEER